MAHAVTIPEVAASAGDDALVEAARHDPQAFEALYLRHRASVYRYLRARVGDDDDAADLTAIDLRAGARGRSAGTGRRGRGSRRGCCASPGTRRSTRSAGGAGGGPCRLTTGSRWPARRGPMRAWTAAEARVDLLRRLGALPDLQRDALVLRYGSRLTAAEIGAVIGKTEAATQKLLTRALGALKEAYRDHE